MNPHRCAWATTDLGIAYHDQEWGVPRHDDLVLFEFLILEGAQAGLSWETILKKRESYREAFDGFDPKLVASYDRRKIAQLLANPGVIRNRLKIESAISNAQSFRAVQEGLGWETILKKPDSYREGFDGFDPKLVASYDRRKIAQLLANPG